MHTFLIIGGAGYIGSHMVKVLLDRGHRVMILDDFHTGHRDAVVGGELIEGDLGDRKILAQVFSAAHIDCVMHFAARSLVGESVELPLDYYLNNTGKTSVLLQAMKDHGVARFIFSSTAATYGEPQRVPIQEDDPTEPTNPYGRTKLYIERMLEDCDRAHGLKYVSLRYFNAAGADPSGVIGEDHAPETHLLPILMRVALGQREHVQIYGTDWDTPDGTCLRDYVHVNDLAEAHLLAAEHLFADGGSRVFNLGCETGYSVREMIDVSRKVSGQPIPTIEARRRRGDPERLVASSRRIRSELGWRPRFDDPAKIVSTAWNWHYQHPHGYER